MSSAGAGPAPKARSDGTRNRRVAFGHAVCLSRLERGTISLASPEANFAQEGSHLCHELLGLSCRAGLGAFLPAASAARASQQWVYSSVPAAVTPSEKKQGEERKEVPGKKQDTSL